MGFLLCQLLSKRSSGQSNFTGILLLLLLIGSVLHVVSFLGWEWTVLRVKKSESTKQFIFSQQSEYEEEQVLYVGLEKLCTAKICWENKDQLQDIFGDYQLKPLRNFGYAGLALSLLLIALSMLMDKGHERIWIMGCLSIKVETLLTAFFAIYIGFGFTTAALLVSYEDVHQMVTENARIIFRAPDLEARYGWCYWTEAAWLGLILAPWLLAIVCAMLYCACACVASVLCCACQSRDAPFGCCREPPEQGSDFSL